MMSVADWYIALFSFGSGFGIIGFWAAVLGGILAGRNLDEVAEGRKDIRFHMVAELVTGALLIAGAVSIAVDAESPTALVLSTLGLGALVYSLIQSPGHYVATKNRRMVATFVATWLFAIPAMILRFFA